MKKQISCVYSVDMRESIQEFFEAVTGNKPYNENNESIAYWEDFLTFWLKGRTIGSVERKMQLLFQTFQPIFPFDGTLYRGMQLIEGEQLSSKRYASFSSCMEVARHFAGHSEKFGHNIRPNARRFFITVQPEKALDLYTLLKIVEKKTMNRYLQIEIEDREWEREVIAPLTKEMLSKVIDFQLPKEMKEKGAEWL